MGAPWSFGFGLGLRPIYCPDILERKPRVDCLEIISENYMIPGGGRSPCWSGPRADFPVVMHGFSMSLASTDPLDFDYLREPKALADRIQPMWISDHGERALNDQALWENDEFVRVVSLHDRQAPRSGRR